MRKYLVPTVIAAAFLYSNVAFAADEISDEIVEERFSNAAVSELNAKIAVGYSHFDFNDIVLPAGFAPAPNDDQDGFFVEGSISVPVGQQFGLQIDGAHVNLDEDIDVSLSAIGGHFFWRDPSVGLLGIYGEYKEYGNLIETSMIAAEGEFYKDQFSFEWYAGQENLQTPFGDSDFFAGEALAAFYPTENSRIHAGVRRRIETTSFVVGGEIMADTGGVAPSLFVRASVGDDDTTSVIGGLRIYFGSGPKSLIQRHREDDPTNRLQDGVSAAGTCVNNADSSLFAGGPGMGRLPTGDTPTIELANAVPIMRRLTPTFDDCQLTSPGPMYGRVSEVE
ncbi:MAG: hypothetical protein AAGA53_09835 [Pseudomonadota bacterium]